MTDTQPTEHVHKFKPVQTRTLLHKYDQTRQIEGSATAVDTLMQLKCACGEIDTYDLKRRVI